MAALPIPSAYPATVPPALPPPASVVTRATAPQDAADAETLCVSVDVGVRLAERVGELLDVLDVDAAGEREREGLLKRDALAEGEAGADLEALPLRLRVREGLVKREALAEGEAGADERVGEAEKLGEGEQTMEMARTRLLKRSTM